MSGATTKATTRQIRRAFGSEAVELLANHDTAIREMRGSENGRCHHHPGSHISFDASRDLFVCDTCALWAIRTDLSTTKALLADERQDVFDLTKSHNDLGGQVAGMDAILRRRFWGRFHWLLFGA